MIFNLQKRGYTVAFLEGHEYRAIRFDSFWESFRFWLKVRRCDCFNNVKLSIN